MEYPASFRGPSKALGTALIVLTIGGGRSPASTGVRAWERILLPDVSNRLVDPFEEAGAARAIVFLFLSVECPLSNRYAPEVRRLHDRFVAEGVKLWLVYPNAAERPDAIRRHTKAYAFPGRALRDPKHELVERTQATITPEAVLYDSKRQLVYRGRIDDRFVSLGLERPGATRHDLAEALAAVLAGKPVPQASAPAVGCYIADFTRLP